MDFSRGGSDKLSNLGVGKIDLIKKWLVNNKMDNYAINDDLTVDLNGHLYIDDQFPTTYIKIPEYIDFRTIDGFFICQGNTKLTNLKIPAREIGWSLICINNPGFMFFEYCSASKVIVKGDFVFYGNGRELSKNEVEEHFEVSGEIILEKPKQKF